MGLFGEKATLIVAVDRPDLCYLPGDTIKVQVTLTTHKSFNIRRGWLALCATETYVEKVEYVPRDGRGRPDYTQRQVVERTNHDLLYRDEYEFLPHPAEIPAGLIQSFDIALHLPSNAWPTYQGNILKIDWEMAACLDVRLGSNITNKGNIYVVSPKGVLVSRPLQSAGSSDPKVCDLAFRLASTAFLPGDKMKGQLRVMPAKDFKARRVEIELSRVESVYGNNNVRRFRIGRLKFPCNRAFSIGQSESFALGFDLPDEPFLPSVKGRHAHAQWVLTATIRRWLRKSIHHETEVFVCNERPGASPQSLQCPKCGRDNRLSARFCRGCGQALDTVIKA